MLKVIGSVGLSVPISETQRRAHGFEATTCSLVVSTESELASAIVDKLLRQLTHERRVVLTAIYPADAAWYHQLDVVGSIIPNRRLQLYQIKDTVGMKIFTDIVAEIAGILIVDAAVEPSSASLTKLGSKRVSDIGYMLSLVGDDGFIITYASSHQSIEILGHEPAILDAFDHLRAAAAAAR